MILQMMIYLVIDHEDSREKKPHLKTKPVKSHSLVPTQRHLTGRQVYTPIMATNFSERFSMDAKVGGELETEFMGTTQYNFCNLIEEHYNATRHDMTGVFEAYRFDRNTNEGTHCVLMICEQYAVLSFHGLISLTNMLRYKYQD